MSSYTVGSAWKWTMKRGLVLGCLVLFNVEIGTAVFAQQPPITPATPAATPTPAGSASDELDVSWTKLYAEALQAKADIPVTGQPLDETMTRLELVRWLTNTLRYQPDPKKKDIPIKDIPKKTPDYTNVQALLQAGVMSAYPGALFKPKGDLTKLEALAIFGRALKLSAPPKALTESWLALYSDTKAVPAAGRDFIAAAAQAGLLVNVPDASKIGPDEVLTRGETAVLMHQALVYQKKLATIEAPVAQLKIERPIIAAIQVQPATRVTAGQTVTVVAEGSPGGQAKFDLGDLSSGIAMLEASPGQYKGTYKVRAEDVITNPAVVVYLDRAGLSTKVQKLAKLQIGEERVAQAPEEDRDIAPPQRTQRGSSFDNSDAPRPNRRPGGFDDFGSNRGGSSFGRSGYDSDGFPVAPTRPNNYGYDPRGGIASNPRRSTGTASDLFNPPSPFDPPPRQQTVRIRQVSFQPTNRVLYTGDILTVSLEGDVGGRATFRILGYTAPQPMKEISPGFYEGQVQIGRRINIPGGTIEVALTRSGQVSTRNIPEPVNISSSP